MQRREKQILIASQFDSLLQQMGKKTRAETVSSDPRNRFQLASWGFVLAVRRKIS